MWIRLPTWAGLRARFLPVAPAIAESLAYHWRVKLRPAGDQLPVEEISVLPTLGRPEMVSVSRGRWLGPYNQIRPRKRCR